MAGGGSASCFCSAVNIFRSQAGNLQSPQLESWLTIQINLWAGGIDSTLQISFASVNVELCVCARVCVWCDLYGVSVNPLIEE